MISFLNLFRKQRWYGIEQGGRALQDFSFLTSSTKVKSDSRVKPPRVLRRVGVLNAVFMEQITSLLATGEVSTDILGLGLEITEIKVSPDFSCVNVYWFSSGTEKDETIEPILTSIAGKLRHVLSQLRVIGVVPPIIFVKDTKYSKLAEVEALLASVDFGEDFVPTTLGASLRAPPKPPSFHSARNISDTLKSDILDMERKNEDRDGDGDETHADPNPESEPQPGPELEPAHPLSAVFMRHDVLGLNHGRIMENVS
jgi:ribosome-binding factor A